MCIKVVMMFDIYKLAMRDLSIQIGLVSNTNRRGRSKTPTSYRLVIDLSNVSFEY